MKNPILLAFLLLFVNFIQGQECNTPEEINKIINQIISKDKITEDDFYKINSPLFSYEKKEILNLKKCEVYKNSIDSLFYSKNEFERLIAYRLIGASSDKNYNEKLIERINSNEPSLLNVWSCIALMENGVKKASDDLFVTITAKVNDSQAMQILTQIYAKYSPKTVRKTCWKYIDSNNKTQQIFAIQILASMKNDEKLQKKLVQFLNEWELKNKGWVIYSMGIQKMKNLKPLLSKYAKNKELKSTVIFALENSPTESDKIYAKKLKK